VGERPHPGRDDLERPPGAADGGHQKCADPGRHHGGAAGPAGFDFNLGSQAPNEAWKSLCADVDADGDLDLIVNQVEGTHPPLSYTLNARIFWNDGGGSFTPGPLLAGEMVKGVGELSGDAWPDLVVLNDTDFHPARRIARGDGSFFAGVQLHLALLTFPRTGVVVEDLDQDGDVDVAIRATTDWLGVFQNEGGGVLTTILPLGTDILTGGTTGVHSLVAVDHDGDGWTDLAVGPLERAPNASVILHKRSDQWGWHPPTLRQTFLPSAAADVDLDGDVELFAQAVMFNTRVADGLGANYCAVNPNSTAAPASISAHGSTSVSQNQFVLTAVRLPANQFGIFYYGPATAELPFGDGYRCVGAGGLGTFRLPPRHSGAGGVIDHSVDLSAPPQPAGAILPGSTWHFHAWFRDPAAEGAGFNLSDALSVGFLQ
jgi:hypothetical protein